MENIEIIPAGSLAQAESREEAAGLVYRSFSEFYSIFSESEDQIRRNIAEQMGAEGNELSQTYVLRRDTQACGIFSWYPANESPARQMASLKSLFKLPGLREDIMPRLRDFSRGVAELGGKGAYLARIAVNPGMQRQGLGSLMLRDFERQAREQGLTTACLHVRLDNSRARLFYESCGYAIAAPAGTDYRVYEKTLSTNA